MKHIVVNGVNYLGEFEEAEGKIKLTKAMQSHGEPAEESIVAYFKAENLNELKEFNFGGMGVSYSVSDLSPNLKNFEKIAKLQIKRAKDIALPILENETFDGMTKN